MKENRTRYPGYDLLKEKEHWDDHTREIVLKRLGPFEKHKFLNQHEADLIAAIARHILYDERKELLDYVLHHIDNKLSSPIGEDQRKVGTPEQKVLIREGLKALDKLAQKLYGTSFLELYPQKQLLLLSALDSGKAAPMTEWQTIPQKELFKKLATCRMGNNPSTSVVDGFCRSHDIPNLYICSAAAFVTSGGGNPTETVMAIAARTADHIIEEASKGE